MAKVGIVMGSDSDMPVMSKAADILEKLGLITKCDHFSTQRAGCVFDYAKTAEEKGFKVIIAGAGMAAHLTRNVRSDFPDAGYRYSDAHYISWWKRFPVFHCTDAIWHSGSNCCN